MTQQSAPFLQLTRVFQAPAERVFRAWTEPALMMRWFRPRGYTVVGCEVDLRPGGTWRVRMRSDEGGEYTQHGMYLEIVAPERLVFTQTWEPPEGAPGNATLVTVTFNQQGGTTEVTVHQTGFQNARLRDDHTEGWESSLDVLAELLGSDVA